MNERTRYAAKYERLVQTVVTDLDTTQGERGGSKQADPKGGKKRNADEKQQGKNERCALRKEGLVRLHCGEGPAADGDTGKQQDDRETGQEANAIIPAKFSSAG